MPFTHTGGVAGKAGTIAMQQKIGKLRKHITELEQVVVGRNQCIRQLRTENKKLRKICSDEWILLALSGNDDLVAKLTVGKETRVYDAEEIADRMKELGVEVES